MPVVTFPPIDNATKDGLVAVGGDLDIYTLVEAYNQGIFPWPIGEDYPMAWFSPDPRGILEVADLHVPKSLKKFLKNNPYTITFNQAFSEVLWECKEIKRPHQDSTWITDEIMDSFTQLYCHHLAYSVETWLNHELVGGLYGFVSGNVITGESMFHKAENASKIALIFLLQHLEKHHIPFLDTQMITPVVKSLGGKEIRRSEFIKRLNLLKKMPLRKIF